MIDKLLDKVLRVGELRLLRQLVEAGELQVRLLGHGFVRQDRHGAVVTDLSPPAMTMA